MEMRLLIIGRGAVAVMLAARFSYAGFKVVVADKYGTDKTIELCTYSSFDSKRIRGKVYFSAMKNLDIQSFDLIILCTKLFQLKNILTFLNKNCGKEINKVYVQNGFVEEIVEMSNNDHIAILNMACRLIDPKTSYSSIFKSIHFPSDTSPVVLNAFKKTNFEIISHGDYLYSRLRKFVLACTSAWMAIHNLSIEESFYNKPLNVGLYRAIDETASILSQYALSVDEISVSCQLLRLANNISNEISIGKNIKTKLLSYTSLFQDLERRNGITEIEFLNGKICSMARELGVEAKCNNFLYRAIKFAQKNKLTPLELEKKLHKIIMEG